MTICLWSSDLGIRLALVCHVYQCHNFAVKLTVHPWNSIQVAIYLYIVSVRKSISWIYWFERFRGGGVHIFSVHQYGPCRKRMIGNWLQYISGYPARETFSTWPMWKLVIYEYMLVIKLFIFWWLVIWIREIWRSGPVGGYILPLYLYVPVISFWLSTFSINYFGLANVLRTYSLSHDLGCIIMII